MTAAPTGHPTVIKGPFKETVIPTLNCKRLASRRNAATNQKSDDTDDPSP